MNLKLLVPLLFAAVVIPQSTRGYKILGLFPCNGHSHFIMVKSVMEGLAKRGHQVHVLSHHPRSTPLENYTDLSVRGSVPSPESQMSFRRYDFFQFEILGLSNLYGQYFLIGEHESVMTAEATKKLLESNDKYDLIITESFVMDMVLGFVHKFKVPFILLRTTILPPWTSDFIANPQNPAFVPNYLSTFTPKMTFIERVRNTAGVLTSLAAWYGFFAPKNQQIMRKYFGEDTPPLLDIMKNVSLILTNTDSAIFGARPFASTVIEVGGVHIDPVKKLPQDIEKFIADSPHGVIYFSMGSLLKAASLPEQKKNIILHTFSQLKERVLWKYEDESITQSNKLMVKKWMPQRDILAHPKVKLFISHGGTLGVLEAVKEGKPIVGIPMFGEQPFNVKALESKGVAKYINYHTFDNETMIEALQEMLKPQYTENAKRLSKLFHDRPLPPMDTAIYWVEYVIRNNGARNLRSVAVDLPFYQYLLLDVIVFFIFCVLSSLFSIYYTFKLTLFRKKVTVKAKKKLK